MSVAFTKPPLRAVAISVNDGVQVTSDNFASVRQQVVSFYFYNCTSACAIGKWSSLRLSNLMELYVENCYNLKIRRADFWPSPKVRLINFVNTTIQSLEKYTFTDLPALRLLSLEGGLAKMPLFSTEIRAYLKDLHCGVAFEWFREWWENKHLLKSAQENEVYQIYPFQWGSDALNKSDVYLPIDCSAKPFPNGVTSIDFKQERFSVNDNLYNEMRQPGNPNDNESDDRYPEFSLEPMSVEECATQKLTDCQPKDCGGDLHRGYEIHDYGYCNNSATTFDRIHRAVIAMTRLPVRLVMVFLRDSTPIPFKDLAPIRRRIVVFELSECINNRATQKLHDLYWTNLVGFVTINCSDLVIMKSDFQNSRKLRQIFFRNTTIETLEENTFTNLPSLVSLALEYNLKCSEETADPLQPVMFTQRIRDYLFHLHCGCEFAWFRRWWSNNTARFMQIADDTGAYSIASALNSYYAFKEDQIPIDCAKPIPLGVEFINANQTEFSLNALEC
ncbi:uncharacterized protein LOC129582316 [Paramacrobiotus metropolitanus]|uniref:uncharacterized protein LOC129582316 n=1 Tax=Paramacrobiotus metropolitanus TaxID=2943436 RepID=UPI0024458653|nr:uncharacterized protein LOC129582316 [Paramacrobiotus metropolitanus]